jgi:hypothetical protein
MKIEQFEVETEFNKDVIEQWGSVSSLFKEFL